MKCEKCGQEAKNKTDVRPVRKATAVLRKEKRMLRKQTITRAEIKLLFGLTDGQIEDIPCIAVYGERRYHKKDVVDYLNSGKDKRQSRLHF